MATEPEDSRSVHITVPLYKIILTKTTDAIRGNETIDTKKKSAPKRF